ncbi:hypothetical protein [Alloyangia pacifica]|uniref:hypothetical protein n=1 Tax=Alloyangia pacifica TaxID=311180 RepID=UPI001CD609CD|nr:hypothetical protein [Alloyangia pacifica]MCA0997048.1 hypothetical protein [Alloyangia pacifica]
MSKEPFQPKAAPMHRIACLVALLTLPLLPGVAAPVAAQVSPQNIDAAQSAERPFRWPSRPDWRPDWRPGSPSDRPHRPGRPDWPQRPGWPGWSGGGYGPAYGGSFGLSLDLGANLPGADGSVREPVMTIERGSPAGTRQIRNSPGAPVVSAPVVSAPPATASRVTQPPMVERAPVATPSTAPGQALQGVGEMNGGGAALAQVLSSDGENYVLLLTLPETRVTCLGQLDGPPAIFPSMGSALACTDGAQGNALFATPEEGTGSSASFTLDGGRGGYLVFP